MPQRIRRFLAGFGVYLDRRMLALFFLGFSSGLPRLLVYSTLSFWLSKEGLSIKTVGLFASTALPYNVKFLWAPLVDRFRLPFLADWLGLRRAWMVLSQVGLVGAIVALSKVDVGAEPLLTAQLAILVAVFSATQDIVIDAFRIEILKDEEQGAGAAMAVFGYRISMLVASAGALYLVAAFGSWSTAYLIMALFMSVGLVTTLLLKEPEIEREQVRAQSSVLGTLKEHFKLGVFNPFADFLKRDGAFLVILFVVFFKFGEAMLGTMVNPFLYKSGLNFSATEIANISKTFGTVATILGIFAGGAAVRRLGLLRSLWITGILQMVSNLVYTGQALLGANVSMLAVTVGVDNFAGGLGTAAFVAYLSSLCSKRYTATQYALLTALSGTLHTLVAASAGFIVTFFGADPKAEQISPSAWAQYFALTAVMAIPGLALLWWMSRRGLTALPENP
ncbi:MAG: MFS transporter [Deltaproteobacteria bacterium CG17_big_fil_post_rev_8_21_14_2_50_63_7]|nr:MAG: MFS transporter [Deltaproteobacteria bacterium CG17_big_fil_post_rev_8_21_14_2_50_63_7]